MKTTARIFFFKCCWAEKRTNMELIFFLNKKSMKREKAKICILIVRKLSSEII